MENSNYATSKVLRSAGDANCATVKFPADAKTDSV
jgi:hypothetical protein